ncbi:MAG: ATP-grasp domain-containing protein [Planctomycetota bacterium]|jgi:glutathione synthase/RimK-type ligase-like ATP-grasp enzyme
MRIGLVSCSRYKLPGPEDELVIPELAALGIEGIPIAWDSNPEPDLDAIIIRSAWNYWHQPVEFGKWVQEQADRGRVILNGLPCIRWNLNKRYLKDLEGAGVDIVPSELVEAGSQVKLENILDERAWDEFVIKPLIGGDAHRIIFSRRAEAARAQSALDRLLRREGVLVQQLIPEIRAGELSLIFFDHEFSHCERKIPKAGDLRSQEHAGSRTIPEEASAELIAWGERAMDAAKRILGSPLNYARVDAVPRDGRYLLMELEAIDAHLYLSDHPGSTARFARTIAARMRS